MVMTLKAFTHHILTSRGLVMAIAMASLIFLWDFIYSSSQKHIHE